MPLLKSKKRKSEEPSSEEISCEDVTIDGEKEAEQEKDSYMIKKLDQVSEFLNKEDKSIPNEAMAASIGPIKFGVWLFVIVFVVFGSWAALAPLQSTANAVGTIVLHANKKTIQHFEGGIIKKIHVRDGDFVKEHEPLITLDATKSKATWEILNSQFLSFKANEARLIANRDDLEKIEFDKFLASFPDNKEKIKIIDSQNNIFKSHHESMKGQVSILRQRIKQFENEIEGLKAQKESAELQLELINEEVVVVALLVNEGKAIKPRLLNLQRQMAELRGRRGEFQARIARAGQSIAENELAIINLKIESRKDTLSRLGDIESQVADFSERVMAAKDTLDRIVIKAPQSGIITGLKFHTKDGVIPSGAEIMSIVPQDDEHIVEARLSPMDIDIVHEGMKATVFLSPYSMRTVPMIKGEVIYVSADNIVDKATGEAFYSIHVRLDKEEMAALDKVVKLRPGMQAEVRVNTGTKTPLQYFIDPITFNMGRAFSEQ